MVYLQIKVTRNLKFQDVKLFEVFYSLFVYEYLSNCQTKRLTVEYFERRDVKVQWTKQSEGWSSPTWLALVRVPFLARLLNKWGWTYAGSWPVLQYSSRLDHWKEIMQLVETFCAQSSHNSFFTELWNAKCKITSTNNITTYTRRIVSPEWILQNPAKQGSQLTEIANVCIEIELHTAWYVDSGEVSPIDKECRKATWVFIHIKIKISQALKSDEMGPVSLLKT